MVKKIATVLIVFLFFLFTSLAIYLFEYFPIVSATSEKIVYNFPYPGILPDHPLYFLKVARDRIVDWLTRDNLKKAELYFLYSDKRVASAISLAEKGKIELSISVFSKGEKYFLKIPILLEKAKKQGSSPPAGFVEKLKLANSKHKEVAQSFLRKMPQGVSNNLMEIIKINEKIKTQLEKL